MIRTLFEWLSRSLESTAIIAFIASFIWGILSILLSPCHLASIPLIVGFIDSQGRTSVKRAFFTSALFALGILLAIAIIGMITAMLGRMLGDVSKYGNYFVAGIFFLVGLYLLDVIKLQFKGADASGFKKRGPVAAFILGLIFGVALGPCTFAYMAPVLTVAFSSASKNIFYASSLVLFYGIGHCSVIVFAGTFTGIIQKYLNWTEQSKGAVIVKKICGALIIIAGIYLLKTNFK